MKFLVALLSVGVLALQNEVASSFSFQSTTLKSSFRSKSSLSMNVEVNKDAYKKKDFFLAGGRAENIESYRNQAVTKALAEDGGGAIGSPPVRCEPPQWQTSTSSPRT